MVELTEQRKLELFKLIMELYKYSNNKNCVNTPLKEIVDVANDVIFDIYQDLVIFTLEEYLEEIQFFKAVLLVLQDICQGRLLPNDVPDINTLFNKAEDIIDAQEQGEGGFGYHYY